MLLTGVLRHWTHDRVEREHLEAWTAWHVVFRVGHARHTAIIAAKASSTDPRCALSKQPCKATTSLGASTYTATHQSHDLSFLACSVILAFLSVRGHGRCYNKVERGQKLRRGMVICKTL